MTTGYFLICDILGFSGIVGNTDETELSARIDTWVSLAKNSAETAGVTELQLLSDTLFASTPDSSDGRGRLVRFSQTLLSEGLKQSLPIRGGISFGKYSWGELTYGKAVIAAHKIEASSEWVGVACDAGLPHIADHWGVDSLVCFPAPQRSGPGWRCATTVSERFWQRAWCSAPVRCAGASVASSSDCCQAAATTCR